MREIGISRPRESPTRHLPSTAPRPGQRIRPVLAGDLDRMRFPRRPGKPTDNALAESFNGRSRDECLDQHWFAALEEARQTIERWRVEYNTERPHRALGQQVPEA